MTHILSPTRFLIFFSQQSNKRGRETRRRLRVDEVVSFNRRSTVLELSSTPESLEDEIDGGINKHDGGVGEARSEVDDGGKAGAEVDDGGEAGAKRDGGVDASVSQQQQDDCVVVKDDCDEEDVDDGNCLGASEEGCQNMLEHFGEAIRDENTRSDSDSWDDIWDDERIPDPLSSDSEEDEVAAPET